MNKIIIVLFITASIIIAGISLNTNKSNSITIGFTGDIMIGRLVNEVIGQKGYRYPWGNVLPLLKQTDLTIINLETTLTTSSQKILKVFNYKANPDRVQTLQKADIDVVNLANNHILDFGNEGLFETIQTLDNAGIKHIGAGKNIHAARRAAIVTKNNITIGIIGYTNNEPGWQAEDNKAGTNYIEVGDIETVKQDVNAIRKNVDFVIVTIHWGPNMRERPTQEFIDFAHAMINAGVDIIHGHSAHIFQGIELYKNKVIMYDTGDFVDDYAVNTLLRNDWSFLYQLEADKYGIKEIKLIPIVISNMQVNMAQDKEKRVIIKRIQDLSQEFGTTITNDGVIQVS